MKAVQQPRKRPEIDITLIEDIYLAVAERSAILEKLAQAWGIYEPGGTNDELDHDFWRGVENLMRANRADMARLNAHLNGDDDGEAGGAR